MMQLQEILIQKLYNKGLTSAETRRIIADVTRIIHGDRGLTQTSVNRKLEVLGWETHILDPATLDLIMCVAESNQAPAYLHRCKGFSHFGEYAE
jgi:hypothetical protein